MFHIFLLSKLTIQNSLRYYFVLSKFLDSDSIQTWHDVSPIWKKYIYGQRFWRLKYFENILNDIKCAPLLSLELLPLCQKTASRNVSKRNKE